MRKHITEPRQPPPIVPEDESSPDEPLEIVFVEELEPGKSTETHSVTTQNLPVPQGGDPVEE